MKFSRTTVSLHLFTLALLWPAASRANTIENISFSATATCLFPNCASLGDGFVTAKYNLDLTAQQIVGPWSVSTPFGALNSTAFGASTLVTGTGDPLIIAFSITALSDPLFQKVTLFFDNPEGLGPLSTKPGTEEESTACQPLAGGGCFQDYLLAGTATLATPEPGSFDLLGLAICATGVSQYRKRRNVENANRQKIS